jgi:hypothetical protein
MTLCEFSEFSFGYALTDSLVEAFRHNLGVAPVFANQVAEGKPGGGYDMKLPLNPIPLFFQFKIPSVLIRVTKHMPKGYGTPYYRMALRTRKPNQHQLLLDLEKTQPLVYYATPMFDRIVDLDLGFMKKSIQANCAFIKPSKIGALDSGPHHVSYKKGFPNWVHSEPKEIEGSHDFDSLLADVRTAAVKAREADVKVIDEVGQNVWTNRNRAVLSSISSWLLGERRYFYSADGALRKIVESDVASPSATARNLGYAAQIHYGLTLAFVDADIKKWK